MQVYIVGGAVRDHLLGRPYTDKDFVVVGATPQQMLDAGFIQVGADFPVFLHPTTKAEYALARTERKSGKGYKGFEVYASPDVTLEEDLQRRDLTINAMAIEVKGLMDDSPISGEVIDYYGGIQDVADRILRHVSDAFSEDPLRVLRIARFYGRFYNTDHRFSIAPETQTLIAKINESDELQHLTAERVWQETSRALMQSAPQAYIDCLLNLGSLEQVMPSLAQALTDHNAHHSADHSADNSSHKDWVYHALQTAATLELNLAQRWCLLMTSFADPSLLGQALTPATDSVLNPDLLTHWIKHSTAVANLLKVPKKIAQFNSNYINSLPYLATDLTGNLTDNLQNDLQQGCGHNQAQPDKPQQIAQLIALTKADKDSELLMQLLTLHKVMALSYQQLEFQRYIKAYQQISIKDVDSNLRGSAIGDAIENARIDAIASCLK